MSRMKNLFVLVLAMVSIVTVAGLSACVPPGPAASPTSPIATGIPPTTIPPGTLKASSPTPTPASKPTLTPTPSPSMSQLVFAGNRNGKFALFLINVDGSGEKQITNWPDEDYVHPSWHPDGNMLATARLYYPSQYVSSLKWRIATVDLNGTRKDLMSNIDYNRSLGGPNFSPYGNLIICDGFVTLNLGGVEGGIALRPPVLSGNDYQGKTKEGDWGFIKMAGGGQPSVSPDASVIAFTAVFNYMIRLTLTQSDINALGGPGYQAGLRVGQEYRSARDYPGTRIGVVDFEGTNMRLLTTSTQKYDDTYPTWSPDGKRIAFMSNRTAGKNQIYIMNADGSSGQSPMMLTADTFENHDPAWSPDGNYIAYVSDHSGISELVIIRPDGTGRTRINRVNELVKTPAWRPLPGQALGVPPTISTPSTPPVTTKPPTGTTPPATTTSTTGRLNISVSGTNSPYSIYVNGTLVGKGSATLNLAPGSYRVTIYNSKGTVIKDETSIVIAGKDSIVKVSGAG